MMLLIAIFASPTTASAKGEATAAAGAHHGCQTECATCANTCKQTKAYAQKQGGKYAAPTTLNALDDCISTCSLSKNFISRHSSLMKQACTLCKEACTRCAEACESYKDDKTMKSCADECRKCATSCDKMPG